VGIATGLPLLPSNGFKTGTLATLVSSLVPNGNIPVQSRTNSSATSSTAGSTAWTDLLSEGLRAQNGDSASPAPPRFTLAISSLTKDGATDYGPADTATTGSQTATAAVPRAASESGSQTGMNPQPLHAFNAGSTAAAASFTDAILLPRSDFAAATVGAGNLRRTSLSSTSQGAAPPVSYAPLESAAGAPGHQPLARQQPAPILGGNAASNSGSSGVADPRSSGAALETASAQQNDVSSSPAQGTANPSGGARHDNSAADSSTPAHSPAPTSPEVYPIAPLVAGARLSSSNGSADSRSSRGSPLVALSQPTVVALSPVQSTPIAMETSGAPNLNSAASSSTPAHWLASVSSEPFPSEPLGMGVSLDSSSGQTARVQSVGPVALYKSLPLGLSRTAGPVNTLLPAQTSIAVPVHLRGVAVSALLYEVAAPPVETPSDSPIKGNPVAPNSGSDPVPFGAPQAPESGLSSRSSGGAWAVAAPGGDETLAAASLSVADSVLAFGGSPPSASADLNFLSFELTLTPKSSFAPAESPSLGNARGGTPGTEELPTIRPPSVSEGFRADKAAIEGEGTAKPVVSQATKPDAAPDAGNAELETATSPRPGTSRGGSLGATELSSARQPSESEGYEANKATIEGEGGGKPATSQATMPDATNSQPEGASEAAMAGTPSGIAAGVQTFSAGMAGVTSQRAALEASPPGGSSQSTGGAGSTSQSGDVSAANPGVTDGVQANLTVTPTRIGVPLESSPSNPPVVSPSNEPVSNQPPVRSVSLRMEGQSGETVNVRLTDRAGQIQVSVSSSDIRTAASLQQDLATLSSNLEKVGWKADEPAPGSSPKNSDASADQQSRQQSQRQAPGDGEQQSGRRRPSLSEQWAEMASSQNA
jgi:hypothetical protein